MFITKSHIILGKLEFDFFNQIECELNYENLTNTCEIIMPANLKLDRNKLRSIVKPGDAVRVELGYDGVLNRIFTGYVAGISPSVPIKFRCEDEMWNLKRTNISDHIADCTVESLLKKHFNGIPADYINASLGDVRIDNISKAKVLQNLKELGLYCFFRNERLVIGKVYDPEYAKHVKFHLSGEKCNIESSDLEYRRAEDVKLQVTAVSLKPDGSRLEYKLGDPDGEKRTLNYYNLTLTDLQDAAKRDYNRLCYDGYTGSFTSFFEPFARHGDIVDLTHPDESDRTGSFYIDKVIYKSSTGGYRQTIYLGTKA